jgi:hypothetical protein
MKAMHFSGTIPKAGENIQFVVKILPSLSVFT